MQGKKACSEKVRGAPRGNRQVTKQTRKVKSRWRKGMKVFLRQEERMLKRVNVMSGICHDLTLW